MRSFPRYVLSLICDTLPMKWVRPDLVLCPLLLTPLAQSVILNQMDITTDGFGFMLAFGDLTWLPFTYGLQARFLAFHPISLGPVWSTAIIALELLGLYIFRVANDEKGNFRNGTNPKSELIRALFESSELRASS